MSSRFGTCVAIVFAIILFGGGIVFSLYLGFGPCADLTERQCTREYPGQTVGIVFMFIGGASCIGLAKWLYSRY